MEGFWFWGSDFFSAFPFDAETYHVVTQLHENKNALTEEISLACLEIRARNEEAINSTRTGFTRLRFFTPFFWIFTFCLFLN